MRINTNVSALIANHHLNKTDNALGKSMQRLASGLKLNRAEDDSAGFAIASKMHTQIDCINQTARNGNDGISVVQTAEGALNEVENILQRMRELAVQGANGTNSDDDREAIQSEITALEDELVRIADQTQFNNISLLDGSLERRSYCDRPNSGYVLTTSDYVPANIYGIKVTNGAADFATDNNGNRIGFGSNAKITTEDNYVTVTDDNGFVMKMKIEGSGEFRFDVTDIGTMPIQIGIAEGQLLDIRIPEISMETMGIANTKCSTREECESAINDYDNAISFISSVRSSLGAYQNRLESAVRSIEVAEESMTSAVSRIEDTDMAEEMTEYTQMNVLAQAGVSVLAQANERPQIVLQLLQ